MSTTVMQFFMLNMCKRRASINKTKHRDLWRIAHTRRTISHTRADSREPLGKSRINILVTSQKISEKTKSVRANPYKEEKRETKRQSQ